MKETKYKLYLQSLDTNTITTKIYSYAQIFSGEAKKDLENTYSRHYVIGNYQNTGLFDKNGKEIYEGDVLKIVQNLEWFSGIPIYPVEYKEGYYKNFTAFKDSIIIGNIHENPELLDKTDNPLP